MDKFIAKLREKPESTRRQIAFLATAGVTLVIIALWGTAFYSSAAHQDDQAVASNSPFDDIKSTLANVGSAFQSEKEGIKNTFNFQK